MSQEKIALFLPNLAGGGAERSMVTLANGIAERGFRVHLVLAKKQGVYFDEVSDKVEVIFLNAPRTILSFPHLIRYLQRHRPAALISALENANLAAIWSKLLTGLPSRLIVTERSLNTLLFQSHARLELRILPFLTRIFYRYADQIVAVSKGVEGDLRANGAPADKIAVGD
ncbi:MAG: glycosyltransferase [Anaerolineales bacterium]